MVEQGWGMVEQGLGYHFITSISSHFFNKTDLEQQLFNKLTFSYFFLYLYLGSTS